MNKHNYHLIWIFILIIIVVGFIRFISIQPPIPTVKPFEPLPSMPQMPILINSHIPQNYSILPEVILEKINTEREKQKFARASLDSELTKVSVDWNVYIFDNEATKRIQPPNENYLGSAFIIKGLERNGDIYIDKWISDFRSNKRLCYAHLRSMGLSIIVNNANAICTMIVRTDDVFIADRYYWKLSPIFYELTSGEIN